MARGFFITLEGGEGTGKSTQAARLARRLEGLGRKATLTREPGGSAGAEAIRSLIVEGAPDRWSAMTETLLLYAARRDHLERLIAPALAAGEIVISDRFADSTRAYQGAAGGAPEGLIAALERETLEGLAPDLTLILDLPAPVGLQRARARGGEGRFEGKANAFHESLRAAFLDLAAREPGRCVLIDATPGIQAVDAAIWQVVAGRLGSR